MDTDHVDLDRGRLVVNRHQVRFELSYVRTTTGPWLFITGPRGAQRTVEPEFFNRYADEATHFHLRVKVEAGFQICEKCGNTAEWIRKTQFTGEHYFCLQHAEAEENFMQEDPSSFVWVELK